MKICCSKRFIRRTKLALFCFCRHLDFLHILEDTCTCMDHARRNFPMGRASPKKVAHKDKKAPKIKKK